MTPRDYVLSTGEAEEFTSIAKDLGFQVPVMIMKEVAHAVDSPRSLIEEFKRAWGSGIKNKEKVETFANWPCITFPYPIASNYDAEMRGSIMTGADEVLILIGFKSFSSPL